MSRAMRSVLIVEDDSLVAAAVEAMLEELGYERIVHAATIVEALAAIETDAPDIAVLDASLRGAPAHRIAVRLREKGIPFVVSTGHDPRSLPAPFAAGVALRKPYQLGEFGRALEAALAPPTGRSSA
jgi:CheY-like chemotaxis protein